ncbi:hypothetical protein Tco_0051884 [Tanacetum coccineum]
MLTSEAPTLTHATIEELVAHSIVVILKAQVAMMASTNNPNSEPRKTSVERNCAYEKFTSYQLSYFNGTDGAVGLIRWFKQTESIFSRSKCAEEDKVRFAVSTLTKEALSWWIQSIGIEEAYKITWSELKRLLIEKYCPQTEIKKMEEAITMTQKLIKHITITITTATIITISSKMEGRKSSRLMETVDILEIVLCVKDATYIT